MWFAKWFGGRQDDSEPSEFPPHPAATTAKPDVTAVRATPHNDKSAVTKKSPSPKGFDPYNSGGFDKNKAWERVIR